MPRGRGHVKRRQESFRMSKNEEFDRRMREEMFRSLGLLDISYEDCVTGSDVIEKFHEESRKVRLAAEGNLQVVAEALVTDPPLMTAILCETKDPEPEVIAEFQCQLTQWSSEDVEYSINESGVIPCYTNISECVWHTAKCMDNPLIAYTSSVIQTVHPPPLSHQQHPPADVIYSGEIYRGCVSKHCENERCYCDGDYNSGHTMLPFPQRSVQQVLDSYSEMDYLVPFRYGGKTFPISYLPFRDPKPELCLCADLCAYAQDFKASVQRLRSECKRLDFQVLAAALSGLPPEIILKIEGYLSCREKFILSLQDGVRRSGCPLNLYTGLRVQRFPAPQKCICSTVLYRKPSLWKLLRDRGKLLSLVAPRHSQSTRLRLVKRFDV